MYNFSRFQWEFWCEWRAFWHVAHYKKKKIRKWFTWVYWWSPKKCTISRSQLVCVKVTVRLLWNVYPSCKVLYGHRVYICSLVNSLGIICFVVKHLNRAYYGHNTSLKLGWNGWTVWRSTSLYVPRCWS